MPHHRSGPLLSDPAELEVPHLRLVAVPAGAQHQFAAGLPGGRLYALAAAHVDDAAGGVDLPLLVAAVVAAEVHLHLRMQTKPVTSC